MNAISREMEENVLIETFYLDLHSNQCGYPICCPGEQVSDAFKPEIQAFQAKLELKIKLFGTQKLDDNS